MQKIDVIRLILWFSLMNHKGSLYITHGFLAYAANISTLARLEFLRLSLPPLRFLIFGKRYKVTVCHDRLSLTLGQSDYFTQMVLSLRPLEVNCTIYKCAFGKKKVSVPHYCLVYVPKCISSLLHHSKAQFVQSLPLSDSACF